MGQGNEKEVAEQEVGSWQDQDQPQLDLEPGVDTGPQLGKK